MGISPQALTWITYKLVTAPCCREIKLVPRWRKRCRTLGYGWCSLTSSLQTLTPLILRGCPAPHSCAPRRSRCWGSPAPTHAKKSRDETRASYKQVYLHFDWSTDSRYRFLLHNSTRASAKYAFFFFYSCTKKPKNQQTKRQRVWQYLLTTGTPQPPIDPPPFTLAHHSDFVVSIACLEWLHCQWREVTPLARWKMNTYAKQSGTRAGYLKKLDTPAAHQCVPQQGAEEFWGNGKNQTKTQLEMHKKLGTSLTHFFLNRGKDVKIHLQSAFSYSPTVVMIKAKQTLPSLSTLCCQTDYNLKKTFLLVA